MTAHTVGAVTNQVRECLPVVIDVGSPRDTPRRTARIAHRPSFAARFISGIA